MDRLYTEIIPGDPLNQSRGATPSANQPPFNTVPNQIACNLTTVDWGTNAVGTDSGVHTAQNRYFSSPKLANTRSPVKSNPLSVQTLQVPIEARQ